MKLRSVELVVLGVFIAFVLIPFFVTPAHAAEPSLVQILENLGFTNIAQSSVQTFPAGTYNTTLLAEFAGWHDSSELSYYELDDPNAFNVIFAGPEGNYGYTDPQINKSFTADHEFGFSLLTAEPHRYFTENDRNEYGIQHAKVYENLDEPGMYLIGFENQYGWWGDRDFNDMVFSIKPYVSTAEHYLTVETDPACIITIPGEGWYNNCTYVNLTAPDFVQASGFRYRFDYWDVDGTPQGSNPITVYMDANHTATAHYVAQYYLTVISPYDTPGGEGWYDSCTYANATLLSGVMDHGNGTRRVFVDWGGDASGTNYAKSNPIYMNQNKTAIANWKTQYYLTMGTNFGTVSPSDGWYDAGSIISISATLPSTISGERYVWNGWTGTGTGSYTGLDNPASVTMNAPITETASWTHQYYLTVNSPHGAPGGEGWYDSSDTAYATITPLTVSGLTGVQYVFTHWSDDASGTTSPSNPIVMDGPKTTTANWKTQYYLAVTSPYGTPGGEGWYDSGSTAYATLDTGTIDHGNGTHRGFTFWSGDASGTDYAQSDLILMDGQKTTIANWKTQYYLTLTKTSGGITNPSSSGWYDAGTIVSVTAIPDTYYLFDHWELDSVNIGSDNPYNVTMDTAHTLHAVFVQEMSTLTISVTTGGTTDPSSGEHVYPAGTYVTVTALPDEHYILDHWELDSVDVGSENPYIVFLNPNHTLHAVFAPGNYTLTINAATGGTTNPVVGVYTYAAGTNVSVLANPDIDYVFDHWMLDAMIAGNANPIYILMNDDHELEPVFIYSPPPTYYLTVTTDPVGITTIPGEGWYNQSANVLLTAPDYINVSTGIRYSFNYWDVDGTPLGAGVNPITVHMNPNHTATAHYTLQYYLTVTSPYGSPTPSSGWYDDGTSITVSVTSPWPGVAGTQYVCTGWTGTGSVPASGATASVVFMIDEPSTITWNWKTQHYLTVKTAPTGIATISGEGWYDESTSVPLTAPSVTGYTLLNWDVDGVPKGAGVDSISVIMDAPHTATAHYEQKTSGTVVGGSTVSIKSPLIHTWIGLNVVLMAAIFVTASWAKRRKRKHS